MKYRTMRGKGFPMNLQLFAEGGDDGAETGGDDQDGEEPDEDGEEEEEKTYSQKDVDDVVKKRLAREKRKWAREQQKEAPTGGAKKDEKDPDGEEKNEAEEKAKKAEEKAATLELKWTCLEHDVKKDCVDDVLALAKVHMAKDEDTDIEDAIDAVLKKYPHFKDDYDPEEQEETDGQEKKGWGKRQGKASKQGLSLDDSIKSQMFGK